MNLIFIDIPSVRNALKPFTFTRPVATIRVGIFSLGEKWKFRLAQTSEESAISYLTVPYLQEKYPLIIEADNLIVNPAICPDEVLVRSLSNLETRSILYQGGSFIAARLPGEDFLSLFKDETLLNNLPSHLNDYNRFSYSGSIVQIQHTWDIFLNNGDQIQKDHDWITRNRSSQTITDIHTRTYCDSRIFVEKGVNIKAAIIDAETGPIYLGENTTVHEGAIIKGPLAILDGGHINMGAKIREATTIGPNCKVGGEVKNVVFQANSNKGHEGFMGNSVVGEWCNFGADTNTSNLKNNYQNVRLWDYRSRRLEDSGQTFCGLMMGDHSKCGINTMFNTGTVVGVFANLFGAGFLPKFIPSFSWGGSESLVEFRFEKAVEVLERVLGRRQQQPNPLDVEILRYVWQHRTLEGTGER